MYSAPANDESASETIVKLTIMITATDEDDGHIIDIDTMQHDSSLCDVRVQVRVGSDE